MSWLLALVVLAAPPPPTVLVIDGQTIATVDAGKWAAPARARVCAAKLELHGATASPGAKGRAVACEPEDEQVPDAVLLAPAGKTGALEVSRPLGPPPRAATPVAATSATYLDVVKAHLATVPAPGKKKRPPALLLDLRRVDLDGDGTDEVLLVASSRRVGDTQPARPEDWSLALVRYVDAASKAPRIVELVRHDGTGEQRGPAELVVRGLVDADGDGALEIVLEDRDPWGVSYEVWRFARGAVTRLTQAGMGE